MNSTERLSRRSRRSSSHRRAISTAGPERDRPCSLCLDHRSADSLLSCLLDLVTPGATFGVPAHPGSSSHSISERMSRAARRDTQPELALRQELHRRGRRYRVVLRVPGRNRRTIDIAFPRAKLAVFIDGCFWHGCPQHGTRPARNSEWWTTKLAANFARDRDTDSHLARMGWAVLRIWEHVSAVEAADQVGAALDGLSALRRHPVRAPQPPEEPGTAGAPTG